MLSLSERSRLADIERHLAAEDPRLARMIVDWSVGPSCRRFVEVAAAGVLSTGAFLAGPALGGEAGSVLAMAGVLSLLAVIAFGIWMIRSRRGSSTGKSNGWQPWPGIDEGYLWIHWWWV